MQNRCRAAAAGADSGVDSLFGYSVSCKDVWDNQCSPFSDCPDVGLHECDHFVDECMARSLSECSSGARYAPAEVTVACFRGDSPIDIEDRCRKEIGGRDARHVSSDVTCDAVWNESHYCNPEFDALVETAGTSLDEQARIDAYNEIQRILLESGPVMIPYFYTQLAAVSNEFQGFELKAFSGRSDFRDVSVAP